MRAFLQPGLVIVCIQVCQGANASLVEHYQNSLPIKVGLGLNHLLCFFSLTFLLILTYRSLDLDHPVFALILQEILVMAVGIVAIASVYVAFSDQLSFWCQLYEFIFVGTCLFHEITWMTITFIR